jgi:hypothetical protein
MPAAVRRRTAQKMMGILRRRCAAEDDLVLRSGVAGGVEVGSVS